MVKTMNKSHLKQDAKDIAEKVNADIRGLIGTVSYFHPKDISKHRCE